MNCERVQGLLADHLAGELEGEQAELVRQHVAGCTECARALELLAAERAFLQESLDRQGPPPALRQALEGAIAESAAPAPFRWISLQALARIAALFLCAAGIATIALLMRAPEEEVTPSEGAREGAREVEQLLADIAHLTAKVDILTSRPALWDDQNGRFPRLTAELSRSQQHLIQEDREAAAAVTLAAAKQHETVGDTVGSQLRRDFVLVRLPDTAAAQGLAPQVERRN